MRRVRWSLGLLAAALVALCANTANADRVPSSKTVLPKQPGAKGDITGWFDELYEAASGDASLIPWADEKPNRYLIEWLSANNIIGKNKKAIVIGCGLGDEGRAVHGPRRRLQLLFLGRYDPEPRLGFRRCGRHHMARRAADAQEVVVSRD